MLLVLSNYDCAVQHGFVFPGQTVNLHRCYCVYEKYPSKSVLVNGKMTISWFIMKMPSLMLPFCPCDGQDKCGFWGQRCYSPCAFLFPKMKVKVNGKQAYFL